MAIDWGMIQVALAIGLLWLILPEHWAKVMRPTTRKLWTRIKPRDGQCDYIEWGQMLTRSHWRLHICDSPLYNHAQHQLAGRNHSTASSTSSRRGARFPSRPSWQ